ncbi:MAG: hypothetical protein KF832_00435 [Caldilineaceae bacterium]|nr:hypothetical protein [Caldilineaceae bacterium]
MRNLAALRNVLATLYPLQEDIHRIIADAGLDPAYIQLSTKAINHWHNILTEADKRGRMEPLIAVVQNEFDAYPDLDNAIATYRASAAQAATNSVPNKEPSAPKVINTDGGAYIAGNVTVNNGDFVGRDKRSG